MALDISCMLVIDSTGSMGWIHRYLRDHLSKLITDFDAMGRSIAFGVVAFRDCYCPKWPAIQKFGFHGSPNSGYIFRTEEVKERPYSFFVRREEKTSVRNSNQLQNTVRHSPKLSLSPDGTRGIIPGESNIFGSETFTRNSKPHISPLPEQVPAESALSLISAKGGGANAGESSYYALRESLIMPWPISKQRVIALFTDDKGHLPDIGVESEATLRADLFDAGLDQLHIFTTDRKVDSYTWLSDSPDDPYVFYHSLTKDMEKLQSTFDDFVKTSSSWGFDDDDDDDGFSDWENPFG
jgi:hypothetical protein